MNNIINTNTNTNINNVKIIKKIGAGLFGTTYLVKLKNKNYSLKIQKILEKNTKVSYNSSIYRELDFYSFVNKLKKKEQTFFTKLYNYKIENNCKFKHKPPFKIPPKFKENINKLNKSKLCFKMLIEYHGKTSINNYLKKNKLTLKQLYSISIQIINILKILYKYKYSHNDLHLGNLMIQKTKEKYFYFSNKKIPFYGLKINIIDFGEILHKKYKQNYSKRNVTRLFKLNRKKQYMKELLTILSLLFNEEINLIEDCKKKKKIIPSESKINYSNRGFKYIIKKYPDFYLKIVKKYTNIFPKSKKELIYLYEERNSNKNIITLIKEKSIKKENEELWIILYLIKLEFHYYYPEEYCKKFGWCSIRKIKVSEDFFKNFTNCNNPKKIINLYLSLILL